MYFRDSPNSSCSESMDEQEIMFRRKVQMLWKEECLVDVTLACENNLLTAHKLVLSAYSDYFKEMFLSLRSTNQYPIIFMKDVPHDILEAILEFMYCGEVNVAQYNLNIFMKTAHTLKIKGLSILEDSNKEQHPAKRRRSSKSEKQWMSPPVKRMKGQMQYEHSEFEEEGDPIPHSFGARMQRQCPSISSATTKENIPKPKKKNSYENNCSTKIRPVAQTSVKKNKSYIQTQDASDNSISSESEDVELPNESGNENLKLKEKSLFKFSKHGKYQEKDLLAALEAVENGMSISSASRHFHIPMRTLSTKIQKARQVNQGTFLHMDPEHEVKLMKFIDYTSQITPLTSNQVKLFAWGIDSVLGKNKFGDEGPTKNWWNRFKRKNPKINKVLRSYDFLKSSLLKSKSFSFKALADYLIPIQEIIEAFDLNDKPEHFWSCSEYTISLNSPPEDCVFPSRERFISDSHFPDDGDFVSIMFAGSASGKKISPFFVFKNCVPSEESTKEGPLNAMYDKNFSGFMDSELMLKWFEYSFLPQCPKNRSEDNPVILLLNSSFPLASPKMLELALSENIILLSLMPHLHHTCQPMDVPFIKGVRKTLEESMKQEELRGKTLNDRIPKMIKEPFEKGITNEMVVGGFRVCGIFPLTVSVDQKEYFELHSQLGFDDLVVTSLRKGAPEVDMDKLIRNQNRKIKLLQDQNNETSTSDEEDEFGDNNGCYVCAKDFPKEGLKEGEGKWVKCSKRYCKNYSCEECLPVNYDKTSDYICIDCSY